MSASTNLLCFPLLFCLVLVFHSSASCYILVLPTTAPGEIILRPVACSAPHCWLTRNIYSIYSMQRGRAAQQLGADMLCRIPTAVIRWWGSGCGRRHHCGVQGHLVAIRQRGNVAELPYGIDVYLVKNDRRNSRDTLRQKETKTDRQTDYHLSELKNDQ